MKISKIIYLLPLLLLSSLAQAQWAGPASTTGSIYRPGAVAVGATAPAPSAHLFVDGGTTSGVLHYRAVQGIMQSGSGYTYGIQGTASNTIPSSSGRAYGVYGQAGNATSGANYGVYARLMGSNGGTALFATDDINHNDPSGLEYLIGNKTWAGYFRGDVHLTSKMGIQSIDPQSILSVGGDGDANWTSYFYTPSTTHGSTAVRAEADQPTGFDDRVLAVSGDIESGRGYATALFGSSYTDTPSDQGRAYGVYAQAGNASPGANYGVYSRLTGANGGAAILGADDINFNDPSGYQYLLGNKTWAGYFIGDVQATNAVGIGCTNMNQPTGGSGTHTYRLFVNGGIVGKELIIQNGGSWCDYVFEKDYELTSLEEVEQHIMEKGHLHKTPSAAEIEANEGFEVGNITLNQQEKIEEIFLHLIELDKEVKSLKAENVALKQALKEQK